MLGHAVCHALSFHSQTISHSITNNQSSVETIPSSVETIQSSSFEDGPIVIRPEVLTLHYFHCTDKLRHLFPDAVKCSNNSVHLDKLCTITVLTFSFIFN